MEEFLSTWQGIALFVAFDILAIFAVMIIAYRWLFKRVFDWLFSSLAILLLTPVWAVLFIWGGVAKSRQEVETLFSAEAYIGKKGKTVYLHRFNRYNADGEIVGGYAKFLESSKWHALARLFDVFAGKISFIGCTPMKPMDCAFLSDSEYDRHLAKPGLINPLVKTGSESTDYEEMWESDKKYAFDFGLFKDLGIFFVWIVKQIRGEGNAHLGNTREKSYAKYLLDDERITQSDYDEVTKTIELER